MGLELPDGTACFVDANIFYYHLVETPPFSEPCSSFLQRVVAGRLTGYTAMHVLAEALHKVMLAEAAAKFGLSRTGLVNWLQQRRTRITELSEFQHAARELGNMRLAVVPGDIVLLAEAADLAGQTGLLTNDAMVVALMRRVGVGNLVTNDDDFDGIPGLTVWKPRPVAAP